MFNLAPNLTPGETILANYRATVYTLQNGSTSRGMDTRVYLTNQRLFYKGAIGVQASMPLYTITAVSEEKHSIYNMVRIDFNNGRSEFMTVWDQPVFIQALNAARAGAPVIATAPPAPSAGTSSPQWATIPFFIAFGAIALFAVVCIGGACLGMVIIPMIPSLIRIFH